MTKKVSLGILPLQKYWGWLLNLHNLVLFLLQEPFFEPNHNASKIFTATRKTLVYQDKALNIQSNVLDAQPSHEHIVFS